MNPSKILCHWVYALRRDSMTPVPAFSSFNVYLWEKLSSTMMNTHSDALDHHWYKAVDPIYHVLKPPKLCILFKLTCVIVFLLYVTKALDKPYFYLFTFLWIDVLFYIDLIWIMLLYIYVDFVHILFRYVFISVRFILRE